MLKFDQLTQQDAEVISIAFTNLINGRTPNGCSVTAFVYERSNVQDPNPAQWLNGAAFINTDPTEVEDVMVPAGQVVCQTLNLGRPIGASYIYRFIMTYEDGTQSVQDALQTVTEYSGP